MKKLSIIIATLFSLLFIGCGNDDNATASVNTIGAGVTVTLAAGSSISTYSGTCTTSIVVNLDGTWSVTNTSMNSNDICQYN